MKKHLSIFYSVFPALCLLFSACGETRETPPQAIRPLAQTHVELARSPDPQKIPLYTPAILAADNGRLVAAFEYGKSPKDEPNARILTSDDGGRTWTQRAKMRMTHGRVFKAGKSLYYLGHKSNLRIARSLDNGTTWSETVDLTHPKTGGGWHQSACNVWHDKGNVYLVMERRMLKNAKAWPVSELAPVVMRGKETDDLTQLKNWTLSNEVCAATLIPGYQENKLPWDFFGVPFYPNDYPNATPPAPKRNNAPIGFLESNIVRITDPKHYWHDPKGKTLHVFMRAHTGGTGYAAMLKAVEKNDGTIEMALEKVPSGKHVMFLPFPGGQMRFHVSYDAQTKLYWLLSSQATDSMTRAELLPADRYNLPNNERQRLVLHYSKNMVDWVFAGLVAEGGSPSQARHYAGMDIDGDDLVILSRSGDKDAKNAHEGNIITFHRVKNFRTLVY